MLSRKERLSREEFNRFFSLGKRVHSEAFTLVYSPHNKFHASVVVSKKIAQHAVKRNKMRRRIYDILRNYHKLHKNTGVYIFLTKNGIQTKKYIELKNEVTKQLKTITT